MSLLYCIIDFFNRSYFSSLFLGVDGCLMFPVILFLNRQGNRFWARTFLIITLNSFIFVATTTTPFDDSGRFYFVPVGIMTLLLCELYERRSIIFGFTLPVVTYFISLNVSIPGYQVTSESGMAQEAARIVNFIGVYGFTLSEIYVFVNYVRRMRIQAVEQSKFSALGIMSSGIAHEINNPLAIIKGRTYLVLKHLEQSNKTEIEKDIDVILKTTDRIVKIIHGLRVFSRNADDDPSYAIQSNELVQTALGLCSERFQRAGVIIEVVVKEHFTIQGKEAQLVQVLVNLLNNAYDAIQEYSEKWVRIEVSAKRICVIDSGQGIPEKIAEKLMQPFYTTKSVGKGTGLGLSISKGIIDRHGGELYLDTRHRNTCFVMHFESRSRKNVG
ncbi:MAG: GHKL domain-containing protein [Bdellovibrionaceae bacterium]|nr:GHKL domain-containing protein [Pseudobdellovibrionaceae bacterium]